MLTKCNLLLVSLLYCLCSIVKAQELPPINVFTPNDYGAENQNWSISQGKNKYVYVANNKGLLEYNGEVWTLYNTPNETIMRSVRVVGDRVYTGCYMEFGYWEKSDFGALVYTSLSLKHELALVEDEQFWNIIALEDWVLFQSLNRIYIYNPIDKSFKIIESKAGITKSFLLEDGSVYYQDLGFGLYEIRNGNSVLVAENELFKNEIVINVFSDVDGFVILTQNKGFYHLNSSTKVIKPWKVPANDLIEKVTVYNSLRLNNGDYALGTISNGILLLNKDGEIKYHIDQNKGLNNNTVLNIFEDIDNNIWLGLDNGINCINSRSPIRIYTDDKGDLGTVYTSIIHNENLYLGTNQGLFKKAINSSEAFKFIENTQGQVWNLEVIDNTLFCGHNMGTFIINESVALKIASVQGTWSIKKIENQPNLLMQGNYDGLHILKKENEQWKYRNKIIGFNISSRFFELIDNRVFVNHEYKGIFKVDVNEDFTKVIKTVCDSTLKGSNSAITIYNSDLLYAYKKGVFSYKRKLDRFIKDTLLSKMFTPQNYISGKFINDLKTNKLWGFTNTDFVCVSPGKFSENPTISRVKMPRLLEKGISSYESLLNIDNKNYLFGTSSGYAIVNVNNSLSDKNEVKIEKINSGHFNAIDELVNIKDEGFFKSKNNSLEFTFATPNFQKSTEVFYQHKLEGVYDTWSPWTTEHTARYENLPYGTFSFKVRSKIGKQLSTNVASYTFTINTPWYVTTLAKIAYGLLAIMILYLANRFYLNYHKQQQEKNLKTVKNELALKELENNQQLMSFENEKLTQDIDSKNRELAISTMSLIKKNEFLNMIKKELMTKKDSESGIKDVIALIDKNINNNDDWKFFQNAFNNADKDFLHKIKAKHPSLTPNDLKLCAYLRLNLSSKEIAPLLNISARSVEVKRYRLRKKMELEHEVSLTSYILDL